MYWLEMSLAILKWWLGFSVVIGGFFCWFWCKYRALEKRRMGIKE